MTPTCAPESASTRALMRCAEASGPLRDAIDPVRRFEHDFPEWGASIARALEAPVEDAARELFRFAREVLEPGWSEFPSRAADAVAVLADLGIDDVIDGGPGDTLVRLGRFLPRPPFRAG